MTIDIYTRTTYIKEFKKYEERLFANQISQKSKLHISKQGDFSIDEKYRVEIGGKNKSFKQIKDLPHSFVVADEIEYGKDNKIPLWLFGFVY